MEDKITLYTVTKEEIDELFKLEEGEFMDAVDALVEKILIRRDISLICEYLSKKAGE